MLPAHYALTEILIVVACYFSIKDLWFNKNFYASAGIFLIGLTALIGAIRFGLIDNNLMMNLNRVLAIFSGILALSLISIQIISNNISKKIAEKTKYKESYVKNLTKECFSKNYMKNSNKGLAGGILTNKALKALSHL